MRQVIMLALVVLLVLAVQGCDETVTKSVPAGVTVVGVPAKPVS